MDVAAGQTEGSVMSYRIRVVQEFMPEIGEVWTASHPELLGCHAVGRTLREACDGLNEARPQWIEGQLSRGGTILPEPEDFWVDLVFPKTNNDGEKI